MTDNLLASKTAVFFAVRKKLSNRAITDLFVTLRDDYDVATNDIFRRTREAVDGTRWSAICFYYERAPSFLDPSTEVRETLCGYLLLIEYADYVAVLSSRLALPAAFKTTYLSQVPVSRVEGAIATEKAVFQRMRMRNMSVSRYAMRNKTLEAADLANVVGPNGSRRYAPQTYSVEIDGSVSTATPSTGRIGIRSPRVAFDELREFAENMIDALRTDPGNVSSFIRSFARPITLADALAQSVPITMAIDTNRLVDAVSGNDATIRLVRRGETQVQLTAAEIEALIAQLDSSLAIKGDGKVRTAILQDGTHAASISLNKTRIALRSLALAPASDVDVERLEFALGDDPEPLALHDYLDEANALIVLFGDTGLAYIDGQVFRDESMLDGGATFMRYLHADNALVNSTSEKGTFSATDNAFSATSTFGIVVDHVGAADTILVCDDLGDEWADFIGIREVGGVTQISFYHVKHGDLGLGASSLHVAVGQAQKNLGNMFLPQERMKAKVLAWGTTYNAPNQATQIPRIVRTNGANLLDAIISARTAPDAMRRAIIVTSSLSRQAVQDAFTEIQNGGRPEHSFVQLYWLLQSFFSACSEVGVSGSIVCQP